MKSTIKKILLLLFILSMITITGLFIYFEINNSIYKKRRIEMKNNNELKVNITSSIAHKTISFNNNDIHYYASGQKVADLIIFLHPAFSDHHAFDQQIDYFSKHYHIISIDMIGHGLSQPNQFNDQIDESVEHIQKIIDLEGAKNIHLIGVSLGSLIAQYYALQHPQKVRSLTVLGGYDINKSSEAVTKAQTSVNFGLILRAVFSMKAFRQKASEMTCYSERGRALFYETTKHFTRSSFRVMSGTQYIVKDRANVDPTYPTLILTGEYDIELAKEMAKNWHSYHSNSQYFSIKNAGHCAQIDQPEVFNKIVGDFIKTHTHK